MSDLEYIRASSINTYIECSAKFYFQNIEQVQVPNKPALAFGASIHKALETNFKQKVATRKDLPLEEVKEVFSDTLDNEFQNVEPNDFEEKPGAYKDSGIELVEKYQKEHAYRIFPKYAEQKISVKFKGIDYGLTGTIDLVDEDNVLIDHKTTSRQVTKVPQAYQIQVGGAYPFLLKTLTKEPVNGIRVDFLIRKGAKTTYTQILPVKIDYDERYFFNVFLDVTTGIKNGVFIPNRSHMYCSKRFCQYWSVCINKFGGKVKE
ncbi:MAG: PD-(D/E)XK nuclease family protein [Candidatus Bilamarchaeaceae archaeon]